MSISREDAITLARRLENAVNAHDASRLAAFYTDDAVMVSPVFAEVRGRSAIAETWKTIFSTFPDWTVELSDVLVDGARIAVSGTVTATDRLGWFGLPATGERVRYRAMLLWTVADGKIVYDERIYDLTGVWALLEKARVDRELRMAADVQRALLSRTAHVGRFCYAMGDSVPCRAIGGDFFEFVELPSGDFGVALGDVAGKGPAAALLAALMQGMLAVEAPAGDNPSMMLSRVNRALTDRGLRSRFVTLVYGVLSSDGRFVYSNAGHNPPAVLTRDGIHRLTKGGPMLGAFEDAAFEEETLHLQERDTVIMFSDGVTEARNGHDEEFGDDRLMTCMTTLRERPAVDVVAGILSTVREFSQETPQADDITVAVTRFK